MHSCIPLPLPVNSSGHLSNYCIGQNQEKAREIIEEGRDGTFGVRPKQQLIIVSICCDFAKLLVETPENS